MSIEDRVRLAQELSGVVLGIARKSKDDPNGADKEIENLVTQYHECSIGIRSAYTGYQIELGIPVSASV